MKFKNTDEFPEIKEAKFLVKKEDSVITLVPIIHDALVFSKIVSRVIHDSKPDVLAVEIPKFLEEIVVNAIENFLALR